MRYLKHILYNVGLCVTLLLLTTSCIQDDFVEKTGIVTNEEVQIELFTNAQTYQTPTTRLGTANEDGIGTTPWVFVFEGTDEQAVFVEAEQAFVEEGRSYVALQKNENPCRLLLIANPPTDLSETSNFSQMTFDKATLENLLENEIFEYAVELLCTPRLNSPAVSVVPYASVSDPRPLIPMSAVEDVSQINSQTQIGTPEEKVSLKRIVAKVTIENKDQNFIILGASTLSVSRSGTFYRDDTAPVTSVGGYTDYLAKGSYLGDEVGGIANGIANGSFVNNTFAHPIYIYESAANNATSAIVYLFSYIDYNYYYYRLAFSNLSGNIPVERNKDYKFVINKINGPGYSTVEEARNNPPLNIQYTMTITDNSSVEIIDTGEYYLGLSNSELWMYSDNELVQNFSAVRLTTNATEAMIQGVNRITISVTGGGAGLSLNTTSLTLPATAGGTESTSVIINMGTTFTPGSEGTITVELGTIRKEIKVRRLPAVPTQANVMSLGSEFFRGEIIGRNPLTGSWVTLSDHQTPGLGYEGDLVINENGNGVFAHFTQRVGSIRVVVLYLSRNTNNQMGRVLVYMRQ